jgi:hypothetical protein
MDGREILAYEAVTEVQCTNAARRTTEHDCMEAGGRATQGAIAEDVRAGGKTEPQSRAMDGKEGFTHEAGI